MRALLVGGTGPSGPHLVGGLLDRGYDVTMLHRPGREVAEMPDIEHLHADPHDIASFTAAVGDASYDVVIATYGKVRRQAEALAGRCGHFLGVGGVPIYRGNIEPASTHPSGMKLLAVESDPLGSGDRSEPTALTAYLRAMEKTEAAIFELQTEDAFVASWFRYPTIYGPRNNMPWEWSVIKRAQDGYRRLILPDNGLSVLTRAAGRNAAHAVLCAVDRPDAAGGEVFNVGDAELYSLRQWLEILIELVGGDFELVALPWDLAVPSHFWLPFGGAGSHHVITDTRKIRELLGYRDVVTVAAALTESIEWYSRNPVPNGTYPAFDRFDYAIEDALIETYAVNVQRVLDAAALTDTAPPTTSTYGPR